MDKTESLYELCETIMNEIEECNEKIRDAGSKLTAGDVEYIDKLTHTLKSIKAVIGMMESEDGYSGWYMPRYYGENGGGGGGQSNRGGNSNRGGQSNRGGSSYARGRGRNARRDSRGRYSREAGYSYAEEMDDIVSEIEEMMDDLPDEKRTKVEKLVRELKK